MNYPSCSNHLNLHLVSETKELVSECYRVCELGSPSSKFKLSLTIIH